MFNVSQHINFYKQEFQPVVIALPLSQILKLFFTILSLLAMFTLWQQWQIQQHKASFTQLQQQDAQLQAQLTGLDNSFIPLIIDQQLQQQIKDLQQTLNGKALIQDYLLQQQLKMNYSFSRILASLANSHIPGIWLTQMHIVSEHNHYSLQGKTHNASLLPRYLQALQQQSALTGSGFTLLDIQSDETDQQLLRFTLGRSESEQPGEAYD